MNTNMQPQSKNLHNLMAMMTANFRDIKERFLIKSGSKFISIPVEKIAMSHTENKLVKIVTFENKSFVIDQTLDELENNLNPLHFFRTNRQDIISIHAIKSIEQEYGSLSVILSISPKMEIIVSRKRMKDFKQWVGG